MTSGGTYHSKEKQMIREVLWNEAFNDIINNYKIKPEDINYLCLPGAECIYLKQLLDNTGIRKANIYAVEKEAHCGIQIRKFLDGKGKLYIGKIEDIVIKGGFEPTFPTSGFDIINLDFCGQAFVFSGSSYQRRWKVIQYFLSKQKECNKKVFYILLTLLGARDNTEGMNYLYQTIKKLNQETGIIKEPDDWNHDRLIQEAVPKILIDEALKSGYYIPTDGIDSYRYKQSEHNYNMVTFSYKFQLLSDLELGNSQTKKQKLYLDSLISYYSKEPKKINIE